MIFEVKELSVTALHRQGEGCSRAYHEAGPCTEHHKTVQMRTDGPKFFCAFCVTSPIRGRWTDAHLSVQVCGRTRALQHPYHLHSIRALNKT